MEHALKTWHFDTDNDRLVRLVLSGKKTAVTSLYGKDAIPAMDEEAILVFDNEKKACVTKTKNVMVTEFKRIPEELSRLEGEGSFGEWKRALILESLEKYEEILKDNTFCLIHNDLHFDNILLDEKQTIRLIDFNDSFVAPFDFDLRLLYMSVSLPWKWANTEMDPLQKPKDYQNLFCYVKKYYPELNAVRHLEERMLIYWIFDDFMLLPRFKGREEKERILVHCKKILEGF